MGKRLNTLGAHPSPFPGPCKRQDLSWKGKKPERMMRKNGTMSVWWLPSFASPLPRFESQVSDFSHSSLCGGLFCLFVLILSGGYVYWFQTERKRERETLTGCSCMCPNRVLNPQPRYISWQGIESANFWCTEWCSNQVSHMTRAASHFL